MCVIVAKPSGSTISIDTLFDCWSANSDGAGVAWHEDGKLHIKKGFMAWQEFREFWTGREWDNLPALIHFRIATHGACDADNTHPFWVFPGKLAFAHNGMFTKVPGGSSTLSDTQLFNRHYLKQLPRNFMNNSGIKLFIDDFIGPGNKLAFINDDGDIHIFGEHRGEWDDNGVWFSNMNHKIKYIITDKRTRWAKYLPRTSGYSRSGCMVDSVWSEELGRYATKDEAIDAEEEALLDEDITYDSKPWSSYDDDGEYFCYYCESTFTADEVATWGSYTQPICPICSGSGCTINIEEFCKGG